MDIYRKLAFLWLLSAILCMAVSCGLTKAGDLDKNQAAEHTIGNGDAPTEFSKLRSLAEQGDAKAQYALATLYDDGKVVPRDTKKALKWYHKAADQGHEDAQMYLAAMWSVIQGQYVIGTKFYKGENTSRDYLAALKMFRSAAEQGSPDAQNMLGVMYYKGEGIPRDIVQAYKWVEIAASQGLAEAARNRESFGREMTPEQMAEAKRLAREWKLEHAE